MSNLPQIPPNGFIGGAMQTAAVRNHVQNNSKASANRGAPRRRKTRSPSTAKTARRKSSRKAKGATILKAGSAAAKAWGRKMKAARKKKAKGS